ncbi:MAG TPA: SDR family NAD(P)-dependent oxidoreductase [Pseudonocardiaceae bacterium]|nr:SDR family NAD(P)-dependent oxidoreductase [Pseudonocardiaceae bacterium]
MSTARPVALVTGASSGIGKASSCALVDAGFEVIGTSRTTRRSRMATIPPPSPQ